VNRRALVTAAVGVAVGASVVVALVVGGSRAARLVSAPPSVVAPEDAAPAPEFAGIEEWLNSPRLTMASLRGHVVLVDFWTYSCINCRRTLPFLRALHETYGSRGLTIVGIHTPEFDFEKLPANVSRAVHDLDVTWPVAEDPDRETWDAWRNQYWPADYLVDTNGLVRLTHVGEGDERSIEDAIRGLLPDPGPARASGRPDPSAARLTPETYLGYERGGLVPPDTTESRSDTSGAVRLSGRFTGAVQWLSAAAPGATVTIDTTARDVYAVMAPPAGSAAPQRVEVLLNGAPVPEGRRGASVVVVSGRTYVDVRADDLYHLVTGPSVSSQRVSLTATASGVRWFTFTFGG
jgi:thiol-disulfide isomerase/thioredoxin